MTHRSDQVQDFSFHDAQWSLISRDANQLTVQVTHLNHRRGAPSNPHATDMEIELAHILFQNFRVLSFEPGRIWKRNALGRFRPVGPPVLYEGPEAEERLLYELRTGITVYEFASDADGTYHLDGCGDEPWFTARFTFSSLTIAWDEYLGPAWYTKR